VAGEGVDKKSLYLQERAPQWYIATQWFVWGMELMCSRGGGWVCGSERVSQTMVRLALVVDSKTGRLGRLIFTLT
jgi:hypothetical protein